MLTQILSIVRNLNTQPVPSEPSMTEAPTNITAEVEIYATQYCPFCWRAKDLLSSKGVDYTEIDVGMDSGLRREMTERSGGGRTVPQIFINGSPIGGCDELYALESQGALNPMLEGAT